MIKYANDANSDYSDRLFSRSPFLRNWCLRRATGYNAVVMVSGPLG